MTKIISQNTVDKENQIKKWQSTFYIGDKNAKIRIAIVGNSITFHAIKEDIGWNKNCGMAASDELHDYVHLLFEKLTADGLDVCLMVNQLSYWEGHYRENVNDNYRNIKDFQPDYLIFRLGENIDAVDTNDIAEHIQKLLVDITANKTNVVMTTNFWENEIIDQAIRLIAKKNDYPLVELSDLGNDETMRATGLYEHKGVACHPGDKGMENIAYRIFECLKIQLK